MPPRGGRAEPDGGGGPGPGAPGPGVRAGRLRCHDTPRGPAVPARGRTAAPPPPGPSWAQPDAAGLYCSSATAPGPRGGPPTALWRPGGHRGTSEPSAGAAVPPPPGSRRLRCSGASAGEAPSQPPVTRPFRTPSVSRDRSTHVPGHVGARRSEGTQNTEPRHHVHSTHDTCHAPRGDRGPTRCRARRPPAPWGSRARRRQRQPSTSQAA